MADIHYNNQILHANEDESILDCLLRHDMDYPHSCRAGICQACLIKATNSPIDSKWQEGLPDTLKAKGYFLSCQAKPANNINIQAPDVSECDEQAILIEMENLTHNVIKLNLSTKNLKNWIPGQYLNFTNSDGITRSYSIANIPTEDGYIELHIKVKDDGQMGKWIQKKAHIDMVVNIRGPFGKCYYINPNKSSYDILLVGTGTGLAPLQAIAKNALNEHHEGKITLIHGGCHDDDIYYAEQLVKLALAYHNFEYIPCVLKTSGRYLEGNIFKKAMDYLTNASQMHAYVCGPQETTNQLKTKLFIAGVPSSKIYSDAFI